jgi:copper(I)-binding protein
MKVKTMKNIAVAVAAITLGLSMSTAFAHEYKLGSLEIVHPHARATPPNAPVSGGYMTIHNDGTEADRLLGGEATFADRVEVHEMVMDGDVMKMRQVEGGLEIPAGGDVVLKPGSYHIMFIGLENQLKDGEKVPATLNFEKAGSIEVEFSVEDIKKMNDAMKNDGHGEMNHGDMKHDETKHDN